MKILLSGSIALDRIMNFPGKYADVIQADKLHVLSVSVLLKELKDTRGGVAANIAYTLALLGEKPILYGSVGENAREYMNTLKKMGVDVGHVHYSKLPTATFTVLTDEVDCQVGGFYPGAMSDAAELTIERFKKDDVFVVVAPHDPTQMAKQVAECAALGKRLFYDVGQQAANISGEDIRAGIMSAELLIVNDYEMTLLAKKTGWSEAQIQQMMKVCVVTLGDKGCAIYHEGKEQRVPAVKVGNVVDPTGAGDAFRAGFLYGYVRDWSLEKCAQWGGVAAMYAIEKHGTQEHHFTMKEFEVKYTQTFSS
jgi:adenosine kinase